jgi:hypothetical protein
MPEQEQWEPDIFDLEAYFILKYIKEYDVLKYWPNGMYDIMYKRWAEDGKPDIEVATLTAQVG